jgi:hypothetical protein
MNSKIVASHVAILVPSVRKAADYLHKFDFRIGEEEEWDGEGTKEIYVERDKANSLLLMEPIKPGAYRRAMEKRGPGLHHLAIDVVDLDSFLISLSGTGWLIHPMSIRTIKQVRAAYLARPGFPALIEVQEREALLKSSLFVNEIFIPLDSQGPHLATHIGLGDILRPSNEKARMSLDGRIIQVEDLY